MEIYSLDCHPERSRRLMKCYLDVLFILFQVSSFWNTDWRNWNNFKYNLFVLCEKLDSFALKFTLSFTEFLFPEASGWIALRELHRAFYLFEFSNRPVCHAAKHLYWFLPLFLILILPLFLFFPLLLVLRFNPLTHVLGAL